MSDVIIVGGGPTGLFLAGDLRLAGVRPQLLDLTGGNDLADLAEVWNDACTA
ncbi:FAD-dependent monooxygenase [Nonomuraea zeae]|uniref:FAD-binding domain-containing protein n=1 Tax=Nonomuraea zeae TaxID=1642303 RepID=A0A5S4GQI7_9ACTN|nr:FAD-dependent monooxygenase [Nonomuraea zeae]TMR35022.1 hypothetical protein ETD85_15135 [Nonomuraea zeae]